MYLGGWLLVGLGSILAPNLLPEGGSVYPTAFSLFDFLVQKAGGESKQHPTPSDARPRFPLFSETKVNFDHEIFSFNRSTPQQQEQSKIVIQLSGQYMAKTNN